jgi:hypothetical protein
MNASAAEIQRELEKREQSFQDLTQYLTALDEDGGQGLISVMSKLSAEQIVQKIDVIEEFSKSINQSEARELQRGRVLNILMVNIF